MRKKIFVIALFLSTFSLENLKAHDIEKIKEMICHPIPGFVPELLKQGKSINSLLEGNVGMLAVAIATGADISFIQNLIEQGVNVNQLDDNGSSPITLAVIASSINPKRYDYYLEIVKLLIKHGAELNSRLSQQGSTPLMLLCASKTINNFEELVSVLLEAGADPNIQDKELQLTALHCAIDRQASLNIIQKLLKFGANPNIESKTPSSVGGSAALHLAVWNDADLSVVEALLQAKANPNQLNSNGLAPLNIAIGKVKQSNSLNRMAVVKMLIEHGANPGYTHPSYGSIRKIAEDVLGKDHPMVAILKKD